MLVKYREMSSPREAISAISSPFTRRALGADFLDALGIPLFLFAGGLPGGHKMKIFTFVIVVDLKDRRTKPATAPGDRTVPDRRKSVFMTEPVVSRPRVLSP